MCFANWFMNVVIIGENYYTERGIYRKTVICGTEISLVNCGTEMPFDTCSHLEPIKTESNQLASYFVQIPNSYPFFKLLYQMEPKFWFILISSRTDATVTQSSSTHLRLFLVSKILTKTVKYQYLHHITRNSFVSSLIPSYAKDMDTKI